MEAYAHSVVTMLLFNLLQVRAAKHRYELAEGEH